MSQSTQFGFDIKPLAELIHLGRYHRRRAISHAGISIGDVEEPATKLALVIESAPEEGLVSKIIPELVHAPARGNDSDADHSRNTSARYSKSITSRSATCCGNASKFAAACSISIIPDLPIDGYNKFIPIRAVSRCALYRQRSRFVFAREKISSAQIRGIPAAAEHNLASPL